MKVLITGASGQLGTELRRTCPPEIEITAPASSELDITESTCTKEFINSLRPDVIVNAAAYTAVDRAEKEPDMAFAVNAQGPANLAAAADKTSARLIHVSTDFVFNGKKSSPYLPGDPPDPLSVYGASKLKGEEEVMNLLPESSAIIRTSWVYSRFGNNFVKTMLRLMEERTQLRVVADQAGTPTWARGLAEVIWNLASSRIAGIFHWSDSGIASWYDFACVISGKAAASGILKSSPAIIPINTEDYPAPARRPAYSVLDKKATGDALGLIPPHWQDNLDSMLKEYTEGSAS